MTYRFYNIERIKAMAHKSKYNYFFEREDKSYGCYNTLTNSLVVFDKKTKEKFDEMSNTKIKIDDEFKRKLLKLGFLCDDDNDEQLLVNLSRYRRAFLQKAAYFRILTTTGCNARCSYCYEQGVITKTMNLKTADLVANFILENSNVEKLYIHWFGGEPLLNEKVIDHIMKKIHSKLEGSSTKIYVYFTSNGSLLDKIDMKKIKELWQPTWFQITVDDIGEKYNKIKNYYNKTNNYTLVIKNIKRLLENNIPVNIRINYEPKEIQHTKEIISNLNLEFKSYLDEGSVTITPAAIFNTINTNEVKIRKGHNCQYMQLYNYSKENNYTIDNTPISLPFKGGQCFACHQGSFIIDPYGDLYKCTLTIKDKNASVGNVKEGVKLNKKYLSWINPELPTKCTNCKFLPFCQGGCKGGYLGYIDYMCNRIVPEINQVLERRIMEKVKNNSNDWLNSGNKIDLT